MSDTARRIDPGLLSEVRRYGAFDITSCFNCGNCTSVCPLSGEHGSFPRRMIRSGQVGLKENLLTGMEPWLCYYCGECSETCPREAEPGEYMASLRRFVIAQTDPTGIAKLFYRSPFLLVLLSIILGSALSLILLQAHGGAETSVHWIFSNLVAYEAVHLTGVIVGVLGAVLFAAGIIRFVNLQLKTSGGLPYLFKQKPPALIAAGKAVVREVFTMNRHAECTTDAQTENPWYLTPRFVHGLILWGFLGLAAATALDFLLIYLMGTGIFLPGRALGTVSGLAMLYGTTVAIWKRFTKREKHSAHTHPADAWLLIFLFALGLSGFWLEAVVTFQRAGGLHSWVLLVHVVFAMELILLVAVTKLAHAFYRPISLFLYFLKQQGAQSNV